MAPNEQYAKKTRNIHKYQFLFYLMLFLYAGNIVVRRWIAQWEVPPGGWLSYGVQCFVALATAFVAGFVANDILRERRTRRMWRDE